MNKYIILLFCSLLLGCFGSKPLISATSGISPNGLYEVNLELDPATGDKIINIYSVVSKKLICSTTTLTFEKMRWSKKSNMLFVYEGLSTGNYLNVLVLSKGSWDLVTYDMPPTRNTTLENLERMHYKVLRIDENGMKINVCYSLSGYSSDGERLEYAVSFDANPPLEKRYDIKVLKLPSNEWSGPGF